MIDLQDPPTPHDLLPAIDRLWDASARKLDAFHARWNWNDGAPVVTRDGRWTSQEWTEWTLGFMVGASFLQYEATGDARWLARGQHDTREGMSSHLTHTGVHDHGFQVVSTYGTWWRLLQEGRVEASPDTHHLLELALRVSGATQARRWTPLPSGGYIHSFNGAHSLFADTMRSLRSLALSHRLGHVLCEEQDTRVSILERLVQHAQTTAHWTVSYGEGRDVYDLPGRVAHECLFNVASGSFRCLSTQQGYSPFTTWTRALAWVLTGFAEQLEFLDSCSDDELAPLGGRNELEATYQRAADATAEFHLEHTPTCGVPYWDTGAPGLAHIEGASNRPADPDNPHEPVDSSAAAIAAQGLLRLGARRLRRGDTSGQRLVDAALVTCRTLLAEPYLSTDPAHEGLLLHGVYHRPRGWDAAGPDGIPRGEACAWGDAHLRELASMVQRMARTSALWTFFGTQVAVKEPA